MTVSLNFRGRNAWRSWNNYNSNRPYSKIRLSDVSGKFIDLWGMIDTGADYLQVPKVFFGINGLNINNNHYTVTQIRPLLANGTKFQAIDLVDSIDFEMEGCSTATPVLTPNNGPILIGRIAILSCIDFGMDRTGWLYK